MQPPRLAVLSIEARAAETPGQWRVRWLLRNEAAESLHLERAWVPHGRFRGQGRRALDLQLPPGGAAPIELTVHADEALGTVVENVFFILESVYRGEPWRIFVRMRVEFLPEPRPRGEVVTTQAIQSGACR
jgi:hypothetical protein